MAEDNVGYIRISIDGKTEIQGLTLDMALELVHHEYLYLEELYRHQIRQRIAGDQTREENNSKRKEGNS
ncbi:MAG: hypothetical protein HPY52_10840 [Firmicutes bacterium]|nr:hypothetical protein [Bacillota bacterium]